MDPNANLAEQLRHAKTILELVDNCSDDGQYSPQQLEAFSHEAYRLAELVEALDGWIRKGGFLPEGWSRSNVKCESCDDTGYISKPMGGKTNCPDCRGPRGGKKR
jgi:hypothetical protein